MNCSEEFTIKVIGKLTLEFSLTWEQQNKVREIIALSLKDYDVISTEKSLVASDLNEKINLYLNVRKLENYSKETLKNYWYILMNFATTINKPVATINKNDIRYYLFKFSALKPSTLNTKLAILKSFFQWMCDEEIIPKNPCKQVKQNKLPKRLRGSLKIDELEKLRIACKTDRERALLELLFATGCRISDVVNMNISDIDISKNTIKVIGKGDKERIVFFSDKTKVYLQKYLITRNDSNPALFIASKKPFNRLGKRSMERIMSLLGKRAGLDKSVFPHLIRHTMATLGLQSGADITTIQFLLGHTTPATTQVYAEQSLENISQEYKQHMIQ